MKFRKDKSGTEIAPHKDNVAPTATGIEKDGSNVATTISDNERYERDLSSFAEMHEWDPNIEQDKLHAIHNALDEHDVQAEASLEHELDDNSPYPEVRAAVQNWDDESLSADTFRSWFLGLLFVTLGSGMNMLFSLRQPNITIGMLVTEISVYPLGMALAKILPRKQFSFFGSKWSLNPGPFNKKEHALVVVMANISYAGGAAYSTFALEAMKGFYKKDFTVGFAILLSFCTQITGIAMAGCVRRFLVDPSSIIYPSVLPACALFNTLHDDKSKPDPAKTNGWTITRYRYYFYVMVGSFTWYWFPGWIWNSLSLFAWVTWIKPQSPIVNQLFGTSTGLSLGAPFTAFSLDWTTPTGYLISPLTVPWHSLGNALIGIVVFIWIACPAIHYTNTWYSDYLPMSDMTSYDNTGTEYNVSRVLNPDLTLNLEAYKAYSPIFLSTTFAMFYGLNFAATIGLIVHTGLYHGKDLWKRIRNAKAEPKDIHVRLIEKYAPVPIWWYLALGAVMLTLGFITVCKYDTQLPAWGYVLAIAIALFFLVPVGIIVGIYNIWIGLNIICDLIISYCLPGRPIAMLVFRSLSYNTLAQAVSFSEALKVGLYMKVAPRTLFMGQLIATVWSCLVQVGVFFWAFGNIVNVCTEDQADHYVCPNGQVFYQNSIIWSVIGPDRTFGNKGIYRGLRWFWLVGALFPTVLFFLSRRFPKSPIRWLHAPIIMGAITQIPPAVPLNYIMWISIGLLFSKIIRSRYRGWWMQYNYITSAGLDAGLALSTIVIFLTLQLTEQKQPKWWGNSVVGSTLDGSGPAVLKTVAEGETFGPTAW